MKIKFIEKFSEGLAAVQCYDKETGIVSGYIDRNFRFKIWPKYEKAFDFSEGLAAVQLYGKKGFIDKTGREIIKCDYWDVGLFKNNRCPVKQTKSGFYGYINRKGIYQIDPIYQLAFDFSNGRAVVVLNNCFFVINKKGKIVSEKIANYTML